VRAFGSPPGLAAVTKKGGGLALERGAKVTAAFVAAVNENRIVLGTDRFCPGQHGPVVVVFSERMPLNSK